jgi:hypothetical protein
MKKLLIAAAAVLAISAAAGLSISAQAAPAKSPYCSMPGAANQSWAEYYGCWGSAPRGPNMGMAQPAMMTGPAAPMADTTDYCKLPAAANASWAERYGCWKVHR